MAAFQHGVFGCFSNCSVCVITFFVPCYTEGKIAEKVGGSGVGHALLACIPLVNLICATMLREKVRHNKNIDGNFLMDLLVVCCCCPCALCQEAQEVDALGANMAVSMARE